MSTWFELQNFPGIASHFRKESDNERSHALLVIDHLTKLGVNPVIPHSFDSDLPSTKLGDLSKP